MEDIKKILSKENVESTLSDLIHDLLKLAHLPVGDNFDLYASDVTETKGTYVLSFEMPGIKRDQIKARLEDSKLILEVQHHNHRNLSHLRESISKKYKAVFEAPTRIEPHRTKIHFQKGVLKITIFKDRSAH